MWRSHYTILLGVRTYIKFDQTFKDKLEGVMMNEEEKTSL